MLRKIAALTPRFSPINMLPILQAAKSYELLYGYLYSLFEPYRNVVSQLITHLFQ
jgi:hypothetical protein